jgi:hypothetical protein
MSNMTISKTKLGLMAIPVLAAGAIGVASLTSTSHTSAATPTTPAAQAQTAPTDAPEPNDTADVKKAAEPAGPDTDNIQDGAQDNQADGETADDAGTTAPAPTTP